MRGLRLSATYAAGVILGLCPALAEASETITYTYDARGQVVGVNRSGTVNNGQSAAITYDKAGNRTNYTMTGASTTADFVVSNASVTEGGNLVFTVTRSGITTIAASVSYATSDSTAAAGSDYTSAFGTLSFAAGETTKTVTVTTLDDAFIEGSETLSLTLSGASSGASIITATGTGTIVDDEIPAQLAIGNASVTEGGTLIFTVTRTGNTMIASSASYATAGGTATSGSDFTATSGTVSFAPSETSKTISVSTTDDATAESAETMTVTLSSPSSGTTITGATGAGTINDNDTPLAQLTISNATAQEGKDLKFTITRSNVTTTTVSVTWATADGTAIAGSDYDADSGTITFNPGQTSKNVNIDTDNDHVAESTETMTVTLSSPSSNATIVTPVGTGTITDDD